MSHSVALITLSDELQKMNVLVIGPVFPDGSAEGAQSPLLSTGGSQAHHGVEVAESVFVVPRVTAKEWCVGGERVVWHGGVGVVYV